MSKDLSIVVRDYKSSTPLTSTTGTPVTTTSLQTETHTYFFPELNPLLKTLPHAIPTKSHPGLSLLPFTLRRPLSSDWAPRSRDASSVGTGTRPRHVDLLHTSFLPLQFHCVSPTLLGRDPDVPSQTEDGAGCPSPLPIRTESPVTTVSIRTEGSPPSQTPHSPHPTSPIQSPVAGPVSGVPSPEPVVPHPQPSAPNSRGSLGRCGVEGSGGGGEWGSRGRMTRGSPPPSLPERSQSK